MDLPFQLKFFRKLELYQELKFQDKKALKNPELGKVWVTEKEILKWSRTEHHHLDTTLTKKMVRENILKIEGVPVTELKMDSDESKKAVERHDIGLELAFTNLGKRGYADTDPFGGIKLTTAGLLMGEVIYDMENSGWGGILYGMWYWLVLLTAITGALLVIMSFILTLIRFAGISQSSHLTTPKSHNTSTQKV